MRLSELFQVLIGLFLCVLMECGRTDHVHLKIHVPDIVHKHKHIKTKYVHVFHPKVIHTDHSASIQYLHSRNDPNVGLINGGYPQPLLKMNGVQNELRISQDDFLKWRDDQQRKAIEQRKQLQKKYQQQSIHNDDDEVDDYEENAEEEEETNYEEELYKKHRANKASSAALKKEHKNYKNHNPDYDSSNADKVYAKRPTRKPINSGNKKQQRPLRPSLPKSPKSDYYNKYKVYGITNVDAETSNTNQQYSSIDPTAIDPGYYSTLPKNAQNAQNAALANQDDIYSGLMSKKFNKNIEDKSKLLADINYNRKQQTKNLLQKRRGQ